MLFEGPEPGRAIPSARASTTRIWDGTVRGQADFWVVITPEPSRPIEWVYREEAIEVSPLRVCHSILDDGRLVLGRPDPEHDELFSELLGIL